MAFSSIGSGGTAIDTTAATSWAPTFSPGWSAGEVVILEIALDNVQTTDGQTSLVASVSGGGLSLTKLGEYTNGQGAAAAGATVSVWYGIASANGSSTTISFGSSQPTAKAATVWRFSPTAPGSQLLTAGTLQVLATDGAAAGSMTIGSLASREYIAIRGYAGEGNTTTALTPTAGYTSFTESTTTGGGAAKNIGVRGEFMIATATSFTSNPTSGMGAVDGASVLGVIYENPPVTQGPFPWTADAYIKATIPASLTSDAFIKRVGILGTSSPVVLEDEFTGTATTTIHGRTPDTVGTATWSDPSNLFSITGSGTVSFDGDAAAYLATIAGYADCRVETDVTTTLDANFGGIVFRYTDASNYWRLYQYQAVSTRVIYLEKKVAGVVTLVWSSPESSAVDAPFAIETSGSSIKVYHDGSLRTTVTDTFNETATTIGIIANASAANEVIFALFKVNQPTTGITADAQISAASGTTITGSFTADSYIKTTTSSSLTADAHIKKLDIIQSVTADAFVRRLDIAGSVTADAYISQVTSGSFTSDASIKATISGSLTADAYLRRLDIPGSLTSDAYVKRVDQPGSFTADAYLLQAFVSGITTDAYVRRLDIAGSLTADAYVLKTLSGSLTSDAVIASVVAGSITSDAHIKGTPVALFTADAHISRSGITQGITADAYLKVVDQPGSLTADAYVKREQVGSVTADAYLRQTYGASFTADAHVAGTVSVSATADAYVKATISGSFAADAFLRAVVAGSVTADAYVRQTTQSSLTGDAHVAAVGLASFTASAHISGTSVNAITADAHIASPTSGSFTADAFIRRTDLTASLLVNAHVASTISGSLVADAYLRRSFEQSLTADAHLRSERTGSFVGDAYLLRSFAGSFLSDAYLRATVAASATLDAQINNPNAAQNVTGATSVSAMGRWGGTSVKPFSGTAGSTAHSGRQTSASSGISGITTVSGGD